MFSSLGMVRGKAAAWARKYVPGSLWVAASSGFVAAVVLGTTAKSDRLNASYPVSSVDSAIIAIDKKLQVYRQFDVMPPKQAPCEQYAGLLHQRDSLMTLRKEELTSPEATTTYAAQISAARRAENAAEAFAIGSIVIFGGLGVTSIYGTLRDNARKEKTLESQVQGS
jgi:hypothetical protein